MLSLRTPTPLVCFPAHMISLCRPHNLTAWDRLVLTQCPKFEFSLVVILNPLSPKIQIQILQSDVHTFLFSFLFFQSVLPLVINLVILITFTLDDLLMLLGEN